MTTIQELKEKIAFLISNNLLDQLRVETSLYFKQRLEESENQLSPSILEDANELYDFPGFPTLLAEILPVKNIYDLQNLLGKTFSLTCENCGKTVQIFMPKRIGGYFKQERNIFCNKCKKEYWQKEKANWQIEKTDAEIFSENIAGDFWGFDRLVSPPTNSDLTEIQLEAREKFKTQVCERTSEIDPGENRDWVDLAYGFFLALGLPPEQASNLAVYVGYRDRFWI